MKQILETERLILREFRKEDADMMYQLNLDPEVIQYTGDTAFENIEAAGKFLEKYDHYQKYGLGRWAVIRKADGEFLGWCGLKYDTRKEEYDIGFRFFKKHWNKGYATESAQACIQLGFEKFGMKTIVGRAMQKNLASISVLQKIGLSFDKAFDFDGQEGAIYKIER